jgi:hypothetical protein
MTTFAKSQTPFGRPAFSWTLCVIQVREAGFEPANPRAYVYFNVELKTTDDFRVLPSIYCRIPFPPLPHIWLSNYTQQSV